MLMIYEIIFLKEPSSHEIYTMHLSLQICTRGLALQYEYDFGAYYVIPNKLEWRGYDLAKESKNGAL